MAIVMLGSSLSWVLDAFVWGAFLVALVLMAKYGGKRTRVMAGVVVALGGSVSIAQAVPYGVCNGPLWYLILECWFL